MKRLVRKCFPMRMQSWMRRTYYHSPFLRRLYYFPQDVTERLFRGKEELRPPRSLMTVGDGHFEEIGREFLGYFIKLGKLQPSDRILEIGCGIGRMAIPLTTYLSKEGRYDGLDIAHKEVEWCRKHITPRFYNFRFQHIDIFNEQTNPKGRLRAGSYQFSFSENQFDFIFLTSVFTHMLVADIENYLREISRMLKNGGRLLATYFLLDKQTRERLEKMNSRFHYLFAGGLVIDPAMPEASIAHEETRIRTLHAECALQIQEPVRYGSWSGRGKFLSSQDIIVAKKMDHE